MQTHANGEITVDIRNRVAHLTLNRPQALNALSYEMVLSMATLFSQWSKDASINAVVMRERREVHGKGQQAGAIRRVRVEVGGIGVAQAFLGQVVALAAADL